MESSPRRRRATDVAASLILAVAAFLATAISVHDGGLTFQLGPNDYRYLEGFADHYEIADGVATRWTTYHAKIDLPLRVRGGPVEIAYRYSRVFGQTAQVEVRLAESTVDRFEARGGSVVTRTVRLAAVSETPLAIRFDVDSHEGRDLGLKLDWVTVKVGPTGGISLRGAARFFPVALAAWLFLLFRFGGLGRATALGLGLVFILVLGVLLRTDIYGFTHVLAALGLPLVLLSSGAAWFLRRLPNGAVVVPMFVAAFLIRGWALFLPTTFYPDVENARDYVEIFRGTSGSLAERGVLTQERTNVGYPRRVGGKDYAFPYSPLYFLPFGLASSPGQIEDAVRHAGLAASALEMLPLFWLASRIFSAGAGAFAAFLWILLPPITSRLLLALHATVVGNFLDTLVIASVFALLLEPSSRKKLAAVLATTLASLLVYTSSLFSVSAFFLFVSLLERKLALRLLAILLLCGTLTVTWLYWPFLVAFFTEILPALAKGLPGPGGDAAATASLRLALARIPLFYGFAYPILVVVGFVLARRRSGPHGFRLIAAWSLAFLFMLSLRAFGGGLFKDLKEIVFVAPLVAMLSGAVLARLARTGRPGKIASFALAAGLALFGLARERDYLRAYASPVSRAMTGGMDPKASSSAPASTIKHLS